MAIGVAGWWATKDVADIVGSTEEEGHALKRSVGPVGLTAMGVGAIIGTGIFVVIGEGAGERRPGRHPVLRAGRGHLPVLGAVLRRAGLVVPVSGSAYTYSYATLGELVAFIIGWDLILEYGVSVAAVAVGWGGNVNAFLDAAFGYELPDAISTVARRTAACSTCPRSSSCWRSRSCWSAAPARAPRVNLVMVGVKLVDPGRSSSSSAFTVVQRRQLQARSPRTALNGDHAGGRA